MSDLWSARFKKETDRLLKKFNSSISVDSKMYAEDIAGSKAHAAMLNEKGIISDPDLAAIRSGLDGIKADIDSGKLKIDPEAEDIHMFIEGELTKRVGEPGKRLHTARSRNDQVATDIRLYLKNRAAELKEKLYGMIEALYKTAEGATDAVMPGYTHLQRAQPVTMAHHMLAYAFMFIRDCTRLTDAVKRMDLSPLGSAALAGTTYDIDRHFTAEVLGFSGVVQNSMDGVSDRDFAAELAFTASLIMTHLSRLAEEIILWCSWEFKFVELDDSFATGSSIMPQKKNPDVAELVRGKTGRVYGDLITLLTMLKGLPLAYNKDMQEDKEAVFDAIKTARDSLEIFAPMILTMKLRRDNMLLAAKRGFINATDMADYLTKKGMPFRTAYKITGELVAYAQDKGAGLEDLPLEELKEKCELFDTDVYEAIAVKNCLEKRVSEGGPSAAAVEKQLDAVKEFLDNV